MAQVVSRRYLTAEARVHVGFSPCGICGGKSGTGTGYSLSSSVFPVNIIPPCPLLSYIICEMNTRLLRGAVQRHLTSSTRTTTWIWFEIILSYSVCTNSQVRLQCLNNSI
jgi:hypothetical protein